MSSWFEESFEQRRQKGWEEGYAQGLALGWAQSLLQLLSIRGLLVDSTVRQRILTCSDVSTLKLWLTRAITATRLSDVLEDPAQ